jgi:hypothetical protein
VTATILVSSTISEQTPEAVSNVKRGLMGFMGGLPGRQWWL